MKGRWVITQSGKIVNVKHRCTLVALQMPVGDVLSRPRCTLVWDGEEVVHFVIEKKPHYCIQSIK